MKKYFNEHPLRAILIIALLVRLFAAFFAKGYGMHDDHFGPIQQPYDIINDYSYWENRDEPHGHSIIYPSLHYYLFQGLNSIGVDDPQTKMYIVRTLHAFYSLLIVYFGYLIALHIGNKETAKKVGLVLALFGILPFMSVRNLIEMVTIPPLMGAMYLVVKHNRGREIFWAGLLFGMSFIFRYQTLLMLGGVGFIYIFRKQFLNLAYISLGFILFISLTQGIVDWFAWGYPFAAPIQYIFLDGSSAASYASGPWYQYLLLIFGLLIPPLGGFLIFGWLRSWKENWMIYLPVMLFFVFHSYYTNKQERFILPVIPFIIILGIVGWDTYVKNSAFWKNKHKLLTGMWVWFWIVNTIILLAFTFTYSKKTRVESLYYLSDKANVTGVVVEMGGMGGIKQPTFYLNKQVPVYELFKKHTSEMILSEINDNEYSMPNYFIFYGADKLQERVSQVETDFNLSLVQEKEISPSLLDWVLYKLNPKHNKNKAAYVYGVN